MLKKTLALIMLLPTFSWGASCIVPAKDLEIAGLYPGEPVNQYIAKLNGERIILNFDSDELSREGSLDFGTANKAVVKDINIKGIGEGYIGHIAFNVDSNRIVSVGLRVYIDGNMDRKVAKFMDDVGIPKRFWKKAEYESLHYLCDNYEVQIYPQKDRGELVIVTKSNEAEDFNWVEPKYYFTAKDLILHSTFQKMAIENGSYDNYQLYKNDTTFRKKLDAVFLNKFKLKLDDFDMGRGFSTEDIKGNVLTTEFYQKNNSFGSKKLEMKIAYKASTNEMLVVITDDNNKTNSYGDKKPELVKALLVDY